MITISQLKLPVSHTPDQLKKKILRMLGIQEKDLIQYTIRKRSLDARRKPELFYVYTVHCTVVNEDRVLCLSKGKAGKTEERPYCPPDEGKNHLTSRPVVIGLSLIHI